MLDLTDLKTIKSLLTYYNVSAQKNLGQHFLIDKEALEVIVASAELTKSDYVVEVGPGFGVLTMPLSEMAGRVLAIETDKRVLEILKAMGSGLTNLEILPASILKLDSHYLYAKFKAWAKAKGGRAHYKMVSNLPYYITSHIIKLFLEDSQRPEVMSVMVQKEVAERIAAEPGEMSVLSVSVQIFGHPEIVRIVPRSAFWPQPEVDSAILKITTYKKSPYEISDFKKFFRVVKAGFGERRKQIHNSLAGGLRLEDNVVHKVLRASKIEPTWRAQDLSIEQWVTLYHKFSEVMD